MSAFEDGIRSMLRRLLTGQPEFKLVSKMPDLGCSFSQLDKLGLYLHIPFCRQICPYCPYNKQIYSPEVSKKYVEAVLHEVDTYASLAQGIPITSLYIGGGTPTTMLEDGLDRILEYINHRFDMRCSIHMESHPNDLTPANLKHIRTMGVKHLSIGVEALQDHHLRTLCRPYTVRQVKRSVQLAVESGFDCVNVDMIFGLPNQTHAELEQAGKEIVQLGVDQVATYPLFYFPYTRWFEQAKQEKHRPVDVLRRRKMLAVLEKVFYGAGYRRTSVWAFTKWGAPRYCSVTVPIYLGLGASAGSYLKDVLYFNTFNVEAYIQSLQEGKLPIALSLELSRRMQMAGWLYWRVYETRFHVNAFRRRFGVEFHRVYGLYLKLLSLLGFVKQRAGKIVLSDQGAYWLHVLQDLFSIQYVSRLWGTSQANPWPAEVRL